MLLREKDDPDEWWKKSWRSEEIKTISKSPSFPYLASDLRGKAVSESQTKDQKTRKSHLLYLALGQKTDTSHK